MQPLTNSVLCKQWRGSHQISPPRAGEGECPVTGGGGGGRTREAMWEMSPKNHCQGNVSLEHLATAWWWEKKKITFA